MHGAMSSKGWISGALPEHRENFMKSQKIADSLKNAMGTVLLVMGTFFVCSTLLSIRAVFADPIAPVDASVYVGQSGGNARATSGRQSPRNSNATTTRETVARTAVARGSASRATTRNEDVNSARATGARNVSVRERVNPRSSTRNVVSRKTNVQNRQNARNVRARTVANPSRVSLQGSAIRGNTGTSSSTSYSYLTNKLYTGNYSNIIDSTTGLISDDAYQNCLESYYTCMDEICTARNAAQRRCACAGRVKAFADAESKLETANEELIKVSGELALLIANKGKDVSSAFQLTDAEKVMNCVSWKDVTSKHGVNSTEAIEWCSNHGIYIDGKEVTSCSKPAYCSDTGTGANDFGFNVDSLDGSGSDILASLQAWASAKDNTITILTEDNESVLSAFETVSNIVGNLTGISGAWNGAETKDTLAETWGYELFAHAHNEVCSRVLDSCFNGIYEACGTPPSVGKCADGQSSNCPFNYNSKIDVSSSGDIKLSERSSTSSVNSSASCFGYTNTSGDPYSNLRGPVADARRSIMNKYLLDANADCDVYGEQLRVTAQNIGYQKVAAQQSLQQKRLEFEQEEQEEILMRAQTAATNFNECLSEIYECYTETAESESWPTARIKTYCAQMANIPHCYEEMICMPSGAQFMGVIDDADMAECNSSQNYEENTCRNVVTLSEILQGAYVGDIDENKVKYGLDKADSMMMREKCLRDAMGVDTNGKDEYGIRNWTKPTEADK